MAGASVVEELHKDHSALRNHVAALESLLQTWDGTVSGTEQTPGGTVRARLDGLGAELEVHFRREEEGLFPDAQRLVTAGAAGADHIARFFHEQGEDDALAHGVLRAHLVEMHSLFAEAEAAGGANDARRQRFEALFRLFRTVLELHATKEDELIFPLIERALTPSQREAVLARLAAPSPH